jgi:hypothetical protein
MPPPSQRSRKRALKPDRVLALELFGILKAF